MSAKKSATASEDQTTRILERLQLPLTVNELRRAARKYPKAHRALLDALECLSLRISASTPLNQLFLVQPGTLQLRGLWELPNLMLVDTTPPHLCWTDAVAQVMQPLAPDVRERVERLTVPQQLYWMLQQPTAPITKLTCMDSLAQNLRQCLWIDHTQRSAYALDGCDKLGAVGVSLLNMQTRTRSEFSSVLQTRRDGLYKAMHCAQKLRLKLEIVGVEATRSLKREADDRPSSTSLKKARVESQPEQAGPRVVTVQLAPENWDHFMERREWLRQMALFIV